QLPPHPAVHRQLAARQPVARAPKADARQVVPQFHVCRTRGAEGARGDHEERHRGLSRPRASVEVRGRFEIDGFRATARACVTATAFCRNLERRRSSMAALDWSQCPAVESIPGKVSGAWVFKGTRTPVAIIFENLEDGMTIDEVMEQFPVTRDQVKAVLEFAARSLDAPVS